MANSIQMSRFCIGSLFYLISFEYFVLSSVAEIDRTLKKVQEGIDKFQEILEKVFWIQNSHNCVGFYLILYNIVIFSIFFILVQSN